MINSKLLSQFIDRELEGITAPYQALRKILPTLDVSAYVAWIGSGLSLPHYIGWEEFIRQLCHNCSVQYFSPRNKRRRSNPDYLMEAADRCKTRNKSLYYEALANAYGNPAGHTQDMYEWLCALRFIGYITTNVDPTLYRKAVACHHLSVQWYPSLNLSALYLGKQQRPVFHIHGLIRQPTPEDAQNVVFSKSEFDEAYRLLPGLLLTHVLANHPVLFVGCKLNEPHIRAVFDQVVWIKNKIAENGEQTYREPNYILCGIPSVYGLENMRDIDLIQRELSDLQQELRTFRGLGIEPLLYCKDSDHKELDTVFFNKLRHPDVGPQEVEVSPYVRYDLPDDRTNR